MPSTLTASAWKCRASPRGSKFAENVRHLAFPAREMGGLLFAYMGPNKDNPPPLPKYEALAVNRESYYDPWSFIAGHHAVR